MTDDDSQNRIRLAPCRKCGETPSFRQNGLCGSCTGKAFAKIVRAMEISYD